jgi:hypothetical protein
MDRRDSAAAPGTSVTHSSLQCKPAEGQVRREAVGQDLAAFSIDKRAEPWVGLERRAARVRGVLQQRPVPTSWLDGKLSQENYQSTIPLSHTTILRYSATESSEKRRASRACSVIPNSAARDSC